MNRKNAHKQNNITATIKHVKNLQILIEYKYIAIMTFQSSHGLIMI